MHTVALACVTHCSLLYFCLPLCLRRHLLFLWEPFSFLFPPLPSSHFLPLLFSSLLSFPFVDTLYQFETFRSLREPPAGGGSSLCKQPHPVQEGREMVPVLHRPQGGPAHYIREEKGLTFPAFCSCCPLPP